MCFNFILLHSFFVIYCRTFLIWNAYPNFTHIKQLSDFIFSFLFFQVLERIFLFVLTDYSWSLEFLLRYPIKDYSLMFRNGINLNSIVAHLVLGHSKSQLNIFVYIVLEMQIIILWNFNNARLLHESCFCGGTIESYWMLKLIVSIFKSKIAKALDCLKFAGQIIFIIGRWVLQKSITWEHCRRVNFQKSPVALIRIIFIWAFMDIIFLINYPNTVLLIVGWHTVRSINNGFVFFQSKLQFIVNWKWTNTHHKEQTRGKENDISIRISDPLQKESTFKIILAYAVI